MLVRLSRAPVLSGGLRRITQLFSGTLFLQDPTLLVQRSSEVQHPAPSASFPREQSVVSSYQKNDSQTVLRISLMHRCAISVPLMTTKSVRLSKEMATQTITPGRKPVWRAIVKAGSTRCLGRLQKRLR
ncbi:hypothetical protein TNCV_699191 [Trichonephila clavipes]|nr:hypothetical protein TNCV_699191 [Trichonephila clavipes]